MHHDVSRRRFLKAAGALGVFSAVSSAAPAWAWSSERSVAGGPLATVPPQQVWDAAADPVVRRLFEQQGIAGITELNALLRPWHRNDQPLPAGLPGDLVAFIEEARRPPAWLDRSKLADAFAFSERHGDSTGLLYGFGSGILSCAIPAEARAVFHSKGGENMRERVMKTGKLGYDQATRNAYEPDGEMIVTAIKTRLTHSAVRHLITSSPRWRHGGDAPTPISQRDLIITWHSLATFNHRTLARWRVPVTPAQSEGFLHLWQVTGHYLGIDDAYLPASWSDAVDQSDMTLDPVIAPTAEGVALAEILLSMVSELGVPRPAANAMARYMAGTNNAGDSIADMLQIPRNDFWDSGVEHGWPVYLALHEQGARPAGSAGLSSAFDGLVRAGAGSATTAGTPIFIEMPTANRSEASYPAGS